MGGVRFGILNAKKSSHTALNGRGAYRVDADSPMGSIVLWIDDKTFLLVRRSVHNDLSKLKLPEGVKLPPNTPNMPSSGTTDITEVFSDVRINEPIAASKFAKPAGAPN